MVSGRRFVSFVAMFAGTALIASALELTLKQYLLTAGVIAVEWWVGLRSKTSDYFQLGGLIVMGCVFAGLLFWALPSHAGMTAWLAVGVGLSLALAGLRGAGK